MRDYFFKTKKTKTKAWKIVKLKFKILKMVDLSLMVLHKLLFQLLLEIEYEIQPAYTRCETQKN